MSTLCYSCCRCQRGRRLRTLILALTLSALSACGKPFTTDRGAPATQATAGTEDCAGKVSWLAANFVPSHDAIGDETRDCKFYQAAWQYFLQATQGSAREPAFLQYPDVAGLFGANATPLVPRRHVGIESAALRVAKLPNDPSERPAAAFGSGIRQAGDVQGILADQNGNPIFYSIHVNQAFKKFTEKHVLLTANDLRNAPADLAFSDGTSKSLGVAEYKAAWQVVPDHRSVPPGFIWTVANVPTILRNGNALSLDAAHPRPVTLVLIAFHVAFALDNHPEMIWATFEHLAKDSTADRPISDVAPSAAARPPAMPTIIEGNRDYILFKAHSTVTQSNIPADPTLFNQALQRFDASTPVYRVYPGSKATEDTTDDAVISLNKHMAGLFSKGSDVRSNYRLVGAVWLKHPSTFASGKHFFNLDGQSSDDPKATLSGEAALSSTAMESFTQAPEAFPNCFSCHNTTAVRTNARPSKIIVDAKKLNVSHVMSRFLSELP